MRKKIKYNLKVTPLETDTQIKIPLNTLSPKRSLRPDENFQLSSLEKKKTSSSFNIGDVIVSSELNGKIDTTKWINQANIATPDFKRSHYFKAYHSDSKNPSHEFHIQEEVLPRSAMKLQNDLALVLETEKVSCKRNLNIKFEQILYEQTYYFHHCDPNE